jgi:hypothetical protein
MVLDYQVLYENAIQQKGGKGRRAGIAESFRIIPNSNKP